MKLARTLLGAAAALLIAGAAVSDTDVPVDQAFGPMTGRPMDGIRTGSPLVIEGSGGGIGVDFILYALKLEADRTPIIVNGPCMSACTMLVDVAHAHVCITPKAIFGFHMGRTSDETTPDTSFIPVHYETPGLDAYIASRGGLPKSGDGQMPMIAGFDQMKAFYRPCPGAKS